MNKILLGIILVLVLFLIYTVENSCEQMSVPSVYSAPRPYTDGNCLLDCINKVCKGKGQLCITGCKQNCKSQNVPPHGHEPSSEEEI